MEGISSMYWEINLDWLFYWFPWIISKVNSILHFEITIHFQKLIRMQKESKFMILALQYLFQISHSFRKMLFSVFQSASILSDCEEKLTLEVKKLSQWCYQYFSLCKLMWFVTGIFSSNKKVYCAFRFVSSLEVVAFTGSKKFLIHQHSKPTFLRCSRSTETF